VILDISYFFWIAPALILAFWAQSRVKGSYRKYSQVSLRRRISGAQIARQILDSNSLSDVQIERVHGHLSDHYDPRSRVLRLSPGVHEGNSIAAAGIAAHEVGHAIQHGRGYLPLHLRTYIYPIASFGSNAAMWLFMIGLFIGYGATEPGGFGQWMIMLGIVLFTGYVAFSVVTLPVEFNASSRAMQALDGFGYLDQDELQGARKVLNAAALTYVAGALMAILQLLYMLSKVRR